MIIGHVPNFSRPSLVKRYRNPKSFSQQMVDPEKLICILEAGRQSASYHNEQPWSFVVTTKGSPDFHRLLVSCLAPASAAWAEDAPVLILSVAKLYFDSDGAKNDHAIHDLAAAVSHVITKANALEMTAQPIAGFDAVLARQLFRIPAGYAPVSVLAIGYPEEPQNRFDQSGTAEDRQDTRRPLESLAFFGTWGQSLSSISEQNNRVESGPRPIELHDSSGRGCQVC